MKKSGEMPGVMCLESINAENPWLILKVLPRNIRAKIHEVIIAAVYQKSMKKPSSYSIRYLCRHFWGTSERIIERISKDTPGGLYAIIPGGFRELIISTLLVEKIIL